MSEVTPAVTTDSDQHVYDLLGVGIGPFNLGLAALAEPVEDLDAVFLDGREGFSWHPGMMLDGATIQVPFLADLVTMADPTSSYSFLNHLKETGRLYPFYIRESFYPLRSEYSEYCRWVAGQLTSLRWGQTVTDVRDDDGVFVVTSESPGGTRSTWRARRLVLGVGTDPTLPRPLAELISTPEGSERVLHSSQYLMRRDSVRQAKRIMVLGSGQSAAEIYQDLLDGASADGYHLDWVTRSPRFFPMEYTKLTLEMTSPEYTDYFHALPEATRDRLTREQRSLYKGISEDNIQTIHETLYQRAATGDPADTRMLTNTELTDATLTDDGVLLSLREQQLGRDFEALTDVVIAATGYAARLPQFLSGISDELTLDSQGRLAVAREYTVDGPAQRIYVQNAEEHTHGLTAPDLGMGAHRSSRIINSIMGRPVYGVEERIAFQHFGPGSLSLSEPDVELPFRIETGLGPVTLERIDPERDAELLHRWYTHPRSVYWGMGDADVATVRRVQDEIDANPHHHGWLGRLNGEPLFVMESYDPAHSELADKYPVRDGDIGMHVLVGPPAGEPVPGTTTAVFDAIEAFLFADPRVARIVVEPDERNELIARRNREAGFTVDRVVELHDKRAALSFCTRAARDAVLASRDSAGSSGDAGSVDDSLAVQA